MSRAESASAFATATMSPSLSMNAIADGPSSSASSAIGAGGLGGAARERVLDDGELRAVLEQLAAQRVDLRHRQAAVVGHDQRVGRLSFSVSSLTTRSFSVFVHSTSSHEIGPPGGEPMKLEGDPADFDPPRMGFCLVRLPSVSAQAC